jgi:hypothetical protein
MNPKICLGCVVVLACYGLSPALNANTITVTNTNDSGPGSLRAALAVAHDGDTIDATGVSGTILLTSGELQINHNVTIHGPGAAHLAVNGNATDRVFENFAGPVTISGFTITHGFTSDIDGGGGILNHGGLTLSGTSILRNNTGSCGFFCNGSGGGINSNSGGTLTVTNSIISNNSTGGGGGGMYLARGGTATVTDSTISENSGGFFGGGIDGGGTTMVTNSTISGNTADNGGGVFNDNGTFTGTNSTISDNSADFGGGIDINGGGTTMVTNSTISGNTASVDGGGVFNQGDFRKNATFTGTNSTISGNTASSRGGGVYNDIDGTLSVTNSTISGNSALSGQGGALFNSGAATIGDTILNAGASGGTIDNSGGFASHGYNLASDNGGGVLTGLDDRIYTNPMLGPLRHTGGPTFTHALLPGSPAINAGNPNFTPPPDFDQRGPGYPRVVNGRIDIGSVELQPPAAPTNLTATATACQEITLHWRDNSNNETGFKIEHSNNGVNFSQFATVPVHTTTYVNHLASPGLRYYRVRAYIHVNGGDYNSGYSNIAHATADPCPTPTPTPTPP